MAPVARAFVRRHDIAARRDHQRQRNRPGADQFAGQFAVAGDMRQIWLTIRDVRTWPDYGRVEQYLRSISIVDDLFVRSWSPEGELLLRIDSRGDEDRLSQLLALGGTLVPWVPNEAGAGLPPRSGQLVFVPQWLDSGAVAPGAP